MSSADVRLIQTCYPKIYLACHLALLADAAERVMATAIGHEKQGRPTSALRATAGKGRA